MTNGKNGYRIYMPIAFALVLVAGILLGSLLGGGENSMVKNLLPVSTNNCGKVDNLIRYIDNNYVDSVKPVELETDAIKGLLEDLDPHSAYITADEFHDINDPLMGSFDGIGIQFII
jgi:carboxyl-terminal processing protease